MSDRTIVYVNKEQFKQLLQDPLFLRYGRDGAGFYGRSNVLFQVKRGVR